MAYAKYGGMDMAQRYTKYMYIYVMGYKREWRLEGFERRLSIYLKKKKEKKNWPGWIVDRSVASYLKTNLCRWEIVIRRKIRLKICEIVESLQKWSKDKDKTAKNSKNV